VDRRPRLASGQRDRPSWAALLVALGALAVFAAIAVAVVAGEPHALERDLLLALRTPGDPADPLGPPWLEKLARDVTALGGTGFLAFSSVALAGFLFLDRKPHSARLVLLAILGGLLLASGLKGLFERPRPDLVPHGVRVETSGFPSSHAMMSAVAYLTLGALLARRRRDRPTRWYALGLALLLTLAVGLSRLYLGVHWPSDVLAGWAIGVAWAVACWAVARRGVARETDADAPG
jgi:undecaprenyl-diphosphatase